MNANEWRITNSTIEAEMVRLAGLLAREPGGAYLVHGGLRLQQTAAANSGLRNAVIALRSDKTGFAAGK